MIMRNLAKTTWLLPILVIGLAVVAIKLPTWTSADGPPATDELQVREEDSGPLEVPPLAEGMAEEPAAPDATAEFDDSMYGTY
jgi:hypothetical protein